MTCPNCQAAMTSQSLMGRLNVPVAIDVCLPCQAFWFDGYESLKLTPASVLTLFKLIGEQPPTKPAALATTCACPRCHMRLVPTHDMQRNTRFEYLRCPAEHGRFTTFFNFLREKDFIRPLSPEQIEELRRNMQTVNCSNCGASVDVTAGAACAHCGSPLSMLDMHQAKALVDTLRHADDEKTLDPSWPMRTALAKREMEMNFASFDRHSAWLEGASSAGLVSAALSSIARLLKDNH